MTMSTRIGRTAIRIATASMLVVGSTALLPSLADVALATDPVFTSWPSDQVPVAGESSDPFFARLYMLAQSSGFSLPAGIVGIPVDGTMEFTGTDPITGFARDVQVSTDDPAACNPTAGNSYDVGPCPRLQLDLSGGDSAGGIRFSIDSLTPIVEPGGNRLRHSGGAVIDSITNNLTPNEPQRLIHLNGTDAAINAALADLVYETGPDYRYDGNNGVTLRHRARRSRSA